MDLADQPMSVRVLRKLSLADECSERGDSGEGQGLPTPGGLAADLALALAHSLS